jgi:hypothetical protein
MQWVGVSKLNRKKRKGLKAETGIVGENESARYFERMMFIGF